MKEIPIIDGEEKYIRENYTKIPNKEILDKYGYSIRILYKRLNQFGIPIRDKYNQLLGQTINGWKIIGVDRGYKNYIRWICECTCGCGDTKIKTYTKLINKKEKCRKRGGEC